MEELTTHQKLVDSIKGITEAEVDFFQALFDDLPEDGLSVNEMESVCKAKIDELGVEQKFFEKLVMFYFGYDQAMEV